MKPSTFHPKLKKETKKSTLGKISFASGKRNAEKFICVF